MLQKRVLSTFPWSMFKMENTEEDEKKVLGNFRNRKSDVENCTLDDLSNPFNLFQLILTGKLMHWLMHKA